MASASTVNQCLWLTSSGPSQIELTVIDWIRQWLGCPEGAGGLFVSGASAASVHALVAAREAGGGTCQPCPLHERSDPFHHRAAAAFARRRCGTSTYARCPANQQYRLDPELLADRVAARPRRRDNPDRGVRQRRIGEHGHGGSTRGDRRLLRGGRHMAACGCGLRRIRGRDGAWSASACRNWKSRLHQSRTRTSGSSSPTRRAACW